MIASVVALTDGRLSRLIRQTPVLGQRWRLGRRHRRGDRHLLDLGTWSDIDVASPAARIDGAPSPDDPQPSF
jgi:hypothetical protein